ncbi:MAG: CHAD domain-containing protein [Planctomycetaceae bacterium]
MNHETVAPTMAENSVEELACSVLTDSLTSVRRWLKRAAREWADDDEIVHQLRVFSRRALSALNLFEVLLPESEVRWFRKRVKAVLQAAGRARDLDVLMTIQLRRCGNARKIVAKQWRAERAAAQKPLVKLWRKLHHHDRFRKHVQLLVGNLKTVAADGEHDIRLVCDERILPQFAGLCRSVVNALGHETDVRSLHGLRIAVKRLRYAATQLLPVFKSQKLPEMVKILEELQTQLGEMHDHVVAKQELKRSAARLKKHSHQKILRELIDSETRRIADSVATYRGWLNSDACRELKQCIESIV